MAETTNTRFTLKNVRLSFPSVFKKSVYNGVEGKYEATFLVDKADEATKAKIDKAIEAAIKEAKIKVPSDKRCMKDGDEVEYDGYAGMWSLKASTNKRPQVIDRDKSPLTEDDDRIYAGCYVNASVDIWIQNNQYGKRANANLYAVQFVKDGDPFGAGSVDVSDDFEDLDDDL
jgi:hypothetical protein